MSALGSPQTPIAAWLAAAGLADLTEMFEIEKITPDILAELSDDDLREIGLKLGQRKKFKRALKNVEVEAAEPVGELLLPELSGERRQLTVVFVDLVGSTDLSRRLDPEDMSELLHLYQDAVSGTVARMGGHIDTFLGDGVVAFFGWPLARENAVEQAVLASLSIVGQVAGIDAPQDEKLGCRIGIATGLVVVQPDGQVTGETPNLAARLQSIGAPGTVVVSKSTAELTQGMFAVEAIQAPKLKGFPESTQAYLVTDARLGKNRFEAKDRRKLSAIVGRRAELDTLAALWGDAQQGRGATVRIEGEAGIGKSRLLAGFKSMFHAQDRFVFNYQCAPNYSDFALWPVSQSLRQTYDFSGPAAHPGEHRTRLKERLESVGNTKPEAPGLMAQLIGVQIGPDPITDDLDPRSRRNQTLEMLVRQVECISAIRPLQIILEDAHWADPTTLEYIELLLTKVSKLPVLVVLTSRGSDRLQDAEWTTRLSLGRLRKKESHAMIAEMLADGATGEMHKADSELLEKLTARSEGIPLFLEELTRSVMMARASDTDTGADDIPVTLHDLLMAQLDRLGPAKIVAQSASCIGREFSIDLLCQTLGQTAASLSSALSQLTEAEIIVPAPSLHKADFAFYHALIRDAAYESLLFRDRQNLHSKVLAALDTIRDVPPELSAQHAEAAGDLLRAGEELLRAGKISAKRWANREAEQLLMHALHIIAQWPASEKRTMVEIECRLALGDALGAIHGYGATIVQENYDAARVLAEGAGEIEALFNALRGLWNGIYNSADFVKSLPVAERMRDLAQQTGELRHWVTAQRSLGSNYLSLNDFEGASDAYRDCIARGTDLPDRAATSYGELPIAVAHGMLSQLEAFAGRLDTALQLVERSDQIARANGHPLAINQALAIVSIIHWLRQEPELALKAAEEEGRLAANYGYVHWLAHSEVMIGACEARLNRSSAGLKRLQQGINAWIANGARSYAPVFFCYLADCALDLGEIETARQAANDGIELAHSSGEFFALAELQRLRAHTSEPSDVEMSLQQALKTARDQKAKLYELRILCDALDVPSVAGTEFAIQAREGLVALLDELEEYREGHEMQHAQSLIL